MSMPGLMSALMGGGPIPLPSIACALCLAIDGHDHAAPAKTLAAGWLVCAFHAEVLAHHLAAANANTNGIRPMKRDGARRPLSDSFALPPA